MDKKRLSMISYFIFSKEGSLFLEKFATIFDCKFRLDEPGNDLVFDVYEKTYKIPHTEALKNFKSLITESIKTNRNLLTECYSIVEYENGVDY